MIYLALGIIFIVGYLIGSLNTSIIVGKFYGIDVREHGSGNAGATNALRTLGKKAALITLIGDFLKGIVACLIGYLLQKWLLPGSDIKKLGLMVAGVGCIFGHNWPIYFKFKGGKGVLTSFAVMIMMGPLPTLIVFGVFLIVAILTRYVSLASVIAAIALPIVGYIWGDYLGIQDRNSFVIFTIIIAVVIVIRHRENIKRLLNGTESKLGSSKKDKSEND